MRFGRLRTLGDLLVLAAVAAGCASTDPEPGPPIEVGDGPSVLSVTISNQSHDDPSVGLRVLVDRQELVSDEFLLGKSHQFVIYHLAVEAGDHVVSVLLDDETEPVGQWAVTTSLDSLTHAGLTYWGLGEDPSPDERLVVLDFFDDQPAFE